MWKERVGLNRWQVRYREWSVAADDWDGLPVVLTNRSSDGYSNEEPIADDYDAIGIDPVSGEIWAAWGNYNSSSPGHVWFSRGEFIDVAERAIASARLKAIPKPGGLLLVSPLKRKFKVFTPDGRLVKKGVVKERTFLKLRPGVYLISAEGERIKGVVPN